jgi:FMN reductase
MAGLKLVGICGNVHRPSRTRTLVEAVAAKATDRYGIAASVYDLLDAMPELGAALMRRDAAGNAAAVLDAIEAADVLVVGSPIYKASYTGLFKHLVDLLTPDRLAGKPVILTATGGSDHHALVVEHQLRPLFGFFAAQTVATGIYGSDRDFTDGKPSSETILKRIDAAVAELSPWVRPAVSA